MRSLCSSISNLRRYSTIYYLWSYKAQIKATQPTFRVKFSANIAFYLAIFVAAIHSQNIEHKPFVDDNPFVISLKYIKPYIDEFGLACNEYLDNHSRGVKNFVSRGQELVEAFKSSKRIVDSSSYIDDEPRFIDTASPFSDLTWRYGNLRFSLLQNRTEIRKRSLCETTRNQLTDIHTNGRDLIESFYSKVDLGTGVIGDLKKGPAEQFMWTLNQARIEFSEKECEENCNTDRDCCRKNCKKSCENCKENCEDCEENCVEDCAGIDFEVADTPPEVGVA